MQCMLQGLTVMFRWPLMISVAILGISLVAKILPDRDASAQLAAIVRASNPTLNDASWHRYTSEIVRHPESAPPQLTAGLARIVGPHWQAAFLLIGPRGTIDPEMILPAVVLHSLESGLRGILIVCLIAAMMGALTGSVNAASALFVRDIYQNFLRQKAQNRELLAASYLSSIAVVLVSFLLGLTAPNINSLWGWLVMGLTTGILGPACLRLYWWRANAWGMAAGIFIGGMTAVVFKLFYPAATEWSLFSVTVVASFTAAILGSLLTPETPRAVTTHFYRTTRPFGAWGPFWKELPPSEQSKWRREHRNDIAATVITLPCQVALFMLPMQLLTRNWSGFGVTLTIFLSGAVALYFIWWKNLPPADEEVANLSGSGPQEHPPLSIAEARNEILLGDK